MPDSFFKREFAPKRLAFWIFWFTSHIGLFVYGFLKQKDDPELANLNVLQLSVWMSRGAGLCLAYDGAIILLPVLRNVIKYLRLTFLSRIIPFDENIWFHRQVAYSMLLWTLVHTFSHYINFYRLEMITNGARPAWKTHYETWGGLTGHAMLLMMLLMYTSAHNKIRKTSFETFWYTHHLAFFFMLCLYFHGYGCFVRTANNVCKGYRSWRFTIWSGGFYLFERILREIRARQSTQITKVISHPERTIELQFSKPSFHYKPGQYLFLNIPEISKLQWHPFTITSAPDDPYVSVHIRQVGDFTTALGDLFGCKTDYNRGGDQKGDTKYDEMNKQEEISLSTLKLPSLKIDGPYGAPAEDVFKNEIAILIGCGIGVTPFASVLKNIWYQHKNNRPSKLRRVELFWICREIGSFEWFQSLLKLFESTKMESGFLKFHIYLTSKLRHSTIENIIYNDVKGEYDPLTYLTSRTHYGRPNFTSIFDQMKRRIENGEYLPGKVRDVSTNVGVYYCGPNVLAKSIKAETKRVTTPGVIFNFHKEHF
ncbi:7855_t:CDS:2 [Ambispora leptoticha]|uniref:7855_t:CDS:1 n=1 Tax=Ambispora leptoticha TaxID=144679 RepID=A0A9N8ZDJ9_9GLOM|nr:7855_t:CDS:2 [Ambispora leptoticha]